MINLLSLLRKDTSNTLRIFNLNEKLGDIHSFMLLNDFSQVIYAKGEKYYVLSIDNIQEVFLRYEGSSNPRSLIEITLKDAILHSDEEVEVIRSTTRIEQTIDLLRKSLIGNKYKYKSVILAHDNNFYYFNYSDLDFLLNISTI